MGGRIEARGDARPRGMVAAPQGAQNPAYRRTPQGGFRPATENEKGIVSEQRFTPEMTVDEAFRLHAGARRVFARFHLGGCAHCAISESHTIGQISEDYGIPLQMLLDALNALFEQTTYAVGDKVRIPDDLRAKIPQLAGVPEVGTITQVENGAYIAEFGEVRLQGLAEDFLPAETSPSPA
jgi:hypothetical protein